MVEKELESLAGNAILYDILQRYYQQKLRKTVGTNRIDRYFCLEPSEKIILRVQFLCGAH